MYIIVNGSRDSTHFEHGGHLSRLSGFFLLFFLFFFFRVFCFVLFSCFCFVFVFFCFLP